MGSTQSVGDRRRGYKIIAMIAAIIIVPGAIAWGWDAIQKAQWEAKSGTQSVRVEGALWGDDYELADTATLVSNAQYEETSIELRVHRTSERSSRTPIVVLEIEDEFFPRSCETPRSWMWSTASGSTVTLLCDMYMPLDYIRQVDAVTVGSGTD